MSREGKVHSLTKGNLLAKGRTAEIFAWGQTEVLKLFWQGWAEEDVEYEARLGRLIYEAGASAPAIGDIVELEGRLGLVYERIHGRSLEQELRSKPWQFRRVARILARLHVEMHKVRAPELPSQKERLERKIRAATALPEDLKERATKALNLLPTGDTLCHGDFHLGNVILSTHGPVIIDWIDATHGNPLADVARTSILFRNGHLHVPKTVLRSVTRTLLRKLHDDYIRHYVQLTESSGAAITTWRPPVAAGRLSENIREEQAALIEVVAGAY